MRPSGTFSWSHQIIFVQEARPFISLTSHLPYSMCTKDQFGCKLIITTLEYSVVAKYRPPLDSLYPIKIRQKINSSLVVLLSLSQLFSFSTNNHSWSWNYSRFIYLLRRRDTWSTLSKNLKQEITPPTNSYFLSIKPILQIVTSNHQITSGITLVLYYLPLKMTCGVYSQGKIQDGGRLLRPQKVPLLFRSIKPWMNGCHMTYRKHMWYYYQFIIIIMIVRLTFERGDLLCGKLLPLKKWNLNLLQQKNTDLSHVQWQDGVMFKTSIRHAPQENENICCHIIEFCHIWKVVKKTFRELLGRKNAIICPSSPCHVCC